jgi:hypothetical protein
MIDRQRLVFGSKHSPPLIRKLFCMKPHWQTQRDSFIKQPGDLRNAETDRLTKSVDRIDQPLSCRFLKPRDRHLIKVAVRLTLVFNRQRYVRRAML